jgi:nucleoside phosphorylase
MNLATRLAVVVSDTVYIPAASFYENPVAKQILEPFFTSNIGSIFRLVGSGSSIDEFKAEKRDQYLPGSLQQRVYQSELEQLTGWQRRGRSATRDIGGGWIASLPAVADEFMPYAAAGTSEAEFERRWLDVPEALNSRAFIVEHVGPLLPLSQPQALADFKLHALINREYFGSYVKDFRCGVFQNLHALGGAEVSSSEPDQDVDYGAIEKALRICPGLLNRMMSERLDELPGLANDPDFIQAFEFSQVDTTAAKSDLFGGTMIERRTDLAIITALPKEREAVEAVFGKGTLVAFDDGIHIFSVVDAKTPRKRPYRIVTLNLTEMGNTRAAVGAVEALRRYHPTYMAMLGIAAGCPNPKKVDEHVRLGDVVISSRIVEHDNVKKTAGQPLEYRDSPQRVGPKLMQFVKYLTKEASSFDTRWLSYLEKGLGQLGVAMPSLDADVLLGADGEPVQHPQDERRNCSRHIVHVGGIASGDMLLKDPSHRDELRDRWGVRAIEMEAAGVRDAAWMSQHSEFIAVRGIVDYADIAKGDQWQLPAAVAASAVLKLIVETVIDATAGS